MDQKDGVYINGKSQAIELLKMLSRDERQRILSKIKIMNPSLANELQGNCASFSDLVHLDSSIIGQLYSLVKPEIIGLSLIGSPVELQRKVLSSTNQNLAEISFEMMNSPEASRKSDAIQRAKSQVMQQLNRLLSSN